MIIKELYIENFGKLSKYKHSFSDGLNHFVEDNGFGKTTLSVFIKAMLYGFEENRRHSLDENDRKKYTPWQGGAFGGWLSFEIGGKAYRVERTFGSKNSDDTFNLYNLDTGMLSSDFSDPLGEAIFGIDADGFERTVFLSEKNLSGKNTNPTISAKLSDLVGTEGDIGGFDDAIKLLDDRRRFYQKKGGAGEIADARREISELEEELSRLNAKKDELSETAEKITLATEKIAEIKARKEKILEQQRKEMLAREKRGYEIQYSEMLGALKIDEKREAELLDFFGQKIPTSGEIASVSECISELKRIERNLSSISDNRELSELTSFFSAGTTVAECESMNAKAAKLEDDRTILLAKQDTERTVSSPFVNEPTHADIERHIMALSSAAAPSKSSRGAGILTSIIGALLVALGILFAKSISPELRYFVAIPGIMLILVGIFVVLKPKNSSTTKGATVDAEKFIHTVYGADVKASEPTSLLLAMRSDLERYEAEKNAAAEAAERTKMLEATVCRTEREIRDFLSKFPVTEALTFKDATTEILRKYNRYLLLADYERERDGERGAEREKIHKLHAYVNSFLSCFKTVTDDPITEIRRALAEFEVLRSSLSRRRESAKSFASTHGISEAFSVEADYVPVATDIKERLQATDDELIAAERERSSLVIAYNTATAETERIDELEERLLEKNETVSRYLDNLAVITKAKDMLAAARDSMTAKYLDKTRQGFRKYVTMIDDECGDFTMDTSFTVSKTDLGKTRPAEAYSRGTRDMHSLAIRLSLVDALYAFDTPPLILDDPFIAFDDTHIEKAISVMKKLASERQIIYFTCSKSRRAK